jgi:2,3-bisphosphoglycerate-dependent phosphoglycerate mutase
MKKLVLIRHGESVWNEENHFTGWTDVGLAETGVHKVHHAGKVLRDEGYRFDMAYTSVLSRAIKTLWIILEEMDLMWIPVFRSWRLNERHYGALQGMNKAKALDIYGREQVRQWRRGYDAMPPALSIADARHAGHDPRYNDIGPQQLPLTESLKNTLERLEPYWSYTIAPAVRSGKRVLVAAHGNSLRALIMHLDQLSAQDIVSVNIPAGVPLIYHLDDDLTPIRHFYLAQSETVRETSQSVV